MVKSEFTFTSPSKAVTWTLVVAAELEDDGVKVALLRCGDKYSFGYVSDLQKFQEKNI